MPIFDLYTNVLLIYKYLWLKLEPSRQLIIAIQLVSSAAQGPFFKIKI